MRSQSPLTARHCADYMGFTTEWIRRAIVDGVTVHGVTVRLEAEALHLNGRRKYRIHEDAFIEFLQAIGWTHLPHRASPASNGSSSSQDSPS